MPLFDAVIFDLDGTLVDSLGDIAGSMNHALAAHRLPTHALDAYRHFVGEGVVRLCERATPEGSALELREAVLAAFRAHYEVNSMATTRPFEGVPALVDALAGQGVKLAVLSNKADGYTREIVSGLFPSRPFQRVYGERAGVPRKPDPTSTLALCEELSVSPGRCAFVGDTAIDMLTARNAGMVSVGVTWGFRGADELVKHRAAHVAGTVEGLGIVLGVADSSWRA